jgi:hypothetical protein
MMVSVFIGTSVDGFIARRNGDLDFLPTDGGEPHGYTEFIATIMRWSLAAKPSKPFLLFPPGPTAINAW